MLKFFTYLKFSNWKKFFPFELVFGLIKYNLISLFYWTILFLIANDSLGNAFGIPLLFYSPEYLGNVSGLSFFLLGISLGGFIMGFQTYSYIKLGPRYSFLCLVKSPFLKFCINNSILPITFILFFTYKFVRFQYTEEQTDPWIITFYVGSFLFGITLSTTLSLLFFIRNKKQNNFLQESNENPVQSVVGNKIEWYNYFRSEKKKTFYYLDGFTKIGQSRSTKHLEKAAIEKVYSNNRINAFLFESIALISFFLVGMFNNTAILEIPAAVSIVLLLTIIHMLFSALMSWFHRWSYPIIFLAIYTMNYLSIHTHYFNYRNFAYGLNYEKQKIPFNNDLIHAHSTDTTTASHSYKSILQSLNAWKKQTGKEKPKLIIICSSGGGSRSALWSFSVLQNCSKKLGNSFESQLQLLTGASGGMIGSAYYRELLYAQPNQIQDPKHNENIGKDLLNKLSFSASTHDMFFRLKSFEYNQHQYTQDRGSAFEDQLHQNTNQILEHPLGYYKKPELEGRIPLLALTPTIANDGRRLIISSQSFSFLTTPNYTSFNDNFANENIDFQTYFKPLNPEELRFSTALRMSATFPFIMPMTTLPTQPEMQIMDAGIRDNYGVKFSVSYLYALKDWIKENTSGVVIIQIRDTKRNLSKGSYEKISLIDKITIPFGNMYKNFPRTQDFDQEQFLSMAQKSLPFPVDLVNMNLRENYKQRISLSWHLTKREKDFIRSAVYSEQNMQALAALERLIK